MHEETCSPPPFLVATTNLLPSRYSETDTKLSERSQSPNPHIMTPFLLNVPSRQIHRDKLVVA